MEAEESTTLGAITKATTEEDKADYDALLRAIVNCRVCDTAIALIVVTSLKSPINTITNPNPSIVT
jgi:hypothetical protein